MLLLKRVEAFGNDIFVDGLISEFVLHIHPDLNFHNLNAELAG